MSHHNHNLNNRKLLAGIKKLVMAMRSKASTLSSRVRQHPDYELDHRPTRFVKIATSVTLTTKRRVLSRRINRLIWLRHEGSVWYPCRWNGKILNLALDKNGD